MTERHVLGPSRGRDQIGDLGGPERFPPVAPGDPTCRIPASGSSPETACSPGRGWTQVASPQFQGPTALILMAGIAEVVWIGHAERSEGVYACTRMPIRPTVRRARRWLGVNVHSCGPYSLHAFATRDRMMACMRSRIVLFALFAAVAPACVEDGSDDFVELQADSAALDDLDGSPLDGDSEIEDESDGSIDPDGDRDNLTAEPKTTNACVHCYTGTYTRFSSWGCFYAICDFGDVSLGCFDNVRTCHEQICFLQDSGGWIDASPETVQISSGVGNTNVSWSGCADTNEVWVSDNGAGETLFARDRSGSQNAPWIQIGHTYDFCVYEGTAHSNQLDCVTVTGEYQAPPQSCFQTGCPSGQHCCGFECLPNSLQCQ